MIYLLLLPAPAPLESYSLEFFRGWSSSANRRRSRGGVMPWILNRREPVLCPPRRTYGCSLVPLIARYTTLTGLRPETKGYATF